MALNLTQLDSLVRAADPAVSDANLAVTLSTLVKTPKSGRVTYTSCAAVWGTATAATFAAKLAAAITAGGAFGAVARFVDIVLSGPGIDPANAEVPAQAAAFVAGGLATQDQVDGVFFDVSYPVGDVVTTADVTASRARIARSTAFDAIRQRVQNVLAFYVNETINSGEVGISNPPTWADFLASLPQS